MSKKKNQNEDSIKNFKKAVSNLLSLLGERKVPFLISVVANIISTVLVVAIPWISAVAIDDIVKILQQLRSRTESVNDFPNLEKYYWLKIEELNVYIYENDKKYYVEVPYNAIYLINKSQYNKLLEIVK